MSTLEQFPIKKGRPRKTEALTPHQPENLVTLKSAIEKKKRVTRKKPEGEPTAKLTPQEKKLLTQERKQAISEGVTRKRKLKKDLETLQEQRPLENAEAFRGENGSTIFTGPSNLPIESIPTTESVVYQPDDIDAWGLNDIIGKNTEPEYTPRTNYERQLETGEIYTGPANEQLVTHDDLVESNHDFPEERYQHVHGASENIDPDLDHKLSPEELYAPLLPQAKPEHPKHPSGQQNIWDRMKKWLTRKQEQAPGNLSSRFHNENKKNKVWLNEFVNSNKSTVDREKINEFVENQHRSAVSRDIDDLIEIEDRKKDDARFDSALNEFKDHLEEEDRLYNERVAQQAEEEKALLKAWGPYLKERKPEKIEADINQTISDLESKRFYENGGVTELNDRITEDYRYNPEEDYEDLTYPKELTDRTEYQEELAIKIDNKANESLRTKGRAPRGNIKGFTGEQYYN